MTVEELLGAFTRTVRDSTGVRIEVREVTLDGATNAAVSEWQTVATLPDDAGEAAAMEARRVLVDDARHFRSCESCDQLVPAGWLSAQGYCPACRPMILTPAP